MEADLPVNRHLIIAGKELKFRATASGGPGGQHVNTTNSRVELHFSIVKSDSLGPRQKSRLIEAFGDSIRVTASNRRSQWQNRELARERLAMKIDTALHIDKPRVSTKAKRAAKEKRMESKRLRSNVKKARRRPIADD